MMFYSKMASVPNMIFLVICLPLKRDERAEENRKNGGWLYESMLIDIVEIS